MTDEDLDKIVKDLRDDGYDIDRPIKEAHGWATGTRARVIEDDEDSGVYRDDEGIVTLAINSFSVTVCVDPSNIEMVS